MSFPINIIMRKIFLKKIKRSSLNEAKKIHVKFKELGVKIDYFKNNG